MSPASTSVDGDAEKVASRTGTTTVIVLVSSASAPSMDARSVVTRDVPSTLPVSVVTRTRSSTTISSSASEMPSTVLSTTPKASEAASALPFGPTSSVGVAVSVATRNSVAMLAPLDVTSKCSKTSWPPAVSVTLAETVSLVRPSDTRIVPE